MENQLEIQMFGKFEMVYNGQTINLGHGQTTKAMKLLQLLLFYGKEGIHRSQIEQYLFGVDAEGSIQNNLRVVVHNLRKILEKSGLPEGNYINIEAGVYYFVSDCDVTLDTERFENLLKAAKCASEEEQFELLKEACNLYQGNFLPELYGEDWVIVNSIRFQNLYSECLEKLVEIMRNKGLYKELYTISKHAAALSPLDEWQVYEMEALIELGDVQAALDLYDKTTAMYFDELEMTPSDKMLNCFEHMKACLTMQTSDIIEVQGQMDESEFLRGAFFCQYPSFVDSYRMMSRMMERSGQSVFLLMCTLQDSKGKKLEEPDQLKELSDKLFDAIQESSRRGDVFTRYNLKQYLVMLIGIRKEECSIVTNRIDTNFRKKCNNRNIRVNFHISSVASAGKIF